MCETPLPLWPPSPTPSIHSGPEGSAASGSEQVAKGLSALWPIAVPKLLRPKKLPVKRSSHKAADFGLGNLGQALVTTPVEETPSTLVQPEKTPIQAESTIEETTAASTGEYYLIINQRNCFVHLSFFICFAV
ncbi:hypothetical protein PVAP13_2KG119416 [Panicum virgatum]|uniref:Uncharacterized protein n=1 Tax=Panicum virgatum TaxID=38727 RepID=A0A8T0W0J8_PANVG|nr:hypothetical protein PVAP13_2KG119416 [Panicum virgatum]